MSREIDGKKVPAHNARYTLDEIREALEQTQGVISAAAKYLRCTRSTVYKYINDFPEVKDTYEEIRGARHDWVENQLLKQIGDGNTQATIFYLRTQVSGYQENRTNTTNINYNGQLTISADERAQHFLAFQEALKGLPAPWVEGEFEDKEYGTDEDE